MNKEERGVIAGQEMVKALKFLTDAEELARLEMWNVERGGEQGRKCYRWGDRIFSRNQNGEARGRFST